MLIQTVHQTRHQMWLSVNYNKQATWQDSSLWLCSHTHLAPLLFQYCMYTKPLHLHSIKACSAHPHRHVNLNLHSYITCTCIFTPTSRSCLSGDRKLSPCCDTIMQHSANTDFRVWQLIVWRNNIKNWSVQALFIYLNFCCELLLLMFSFYFASCTCSNVTHL